MQILNKLISVFVGWYYVDSGNNHQIVIYEVDELNKKTGKIISRQTGEVVSLFEATERKKQGLPVIQKNLGEEKDFSSA